MLHFFKKSSLLFFFFLHCNIYKNLTTCTNKKQKTLYTFSHNQKIIINKYLFKSLCFAVVVTTYLSGGELKWSCLFPVLFIIITSLCLFFLINGSSRILCRYIGLILNIKSLILLTDLLWKKAVILYITYVRVFVEPRPSVPVLPGPGTHRHVPSQ